MLIGVFKLACHSDDMTSKRDKDPKPKPSRAICHCSRGISFPVPSISVHSPCLRKIVSQ